MRNLFLIILSLLVVFTQAIQFSKQKDAGSGAPVVWWLGPPNGDRVHQIALFRTWLSNRNLPDVDIRVDTQNQGLAKIIVQGVAGVAGDMPEVFSGQLPFLAQMGILEPLDDLAKQFGLPENNFAEVIREDLFVDGRRYGYPCNLSTALLLVNGEAFRKVGMEEPSYRWDLDTFEKTGKEFVRRANAGMPDKRLYFFCDFLSFSYFRRSVGVTHFNETLTAPALNDPRYRTILKRYHRWVYEDHLIPSASEISSFNVESGGFAGYSMQLFARGNFAMIYNGRHAVVQFRQMGFKGKVSAVEPPHGGYANTEVSTRMVTLFKGSQKKDLAKSFFAFFSSPELNSHVVRNGDAMPPTPGYTESDAFLRPSGHTNEWGLHQGFARSLKENPLPFEYSPFLLKTGVYAKLEGKHISSFLSGVCTEGEALERFDVEVKREMKRYLVEHPELKTRYEEALLRQKKIDEVKARGGKIPLALVDNAILKKYYRDTGKGE